MESREKDKELINSYIKKLTMEIGERNVGGNGNNEIISLLEEKKPEAIICATGGVENQSGCFEPFPIFEDGDFDIPSVYERYRWGKINKIQ